MPTQSLVDYLKTQGKDSSLSSRAQLAVDNGLVGTTADYIKSANLGTNAGLNAQLLGVLQAPAVAPANGPAGTTSATGTPVSTITGLNSGPMSTSVLSTAVGAPEPASLIPVAPKVSLSDISSLVATTPQEGIQKQIDTYRAQLEANLAKEKEVAKATLEGAKGKMSGLVGATTAQDALKAQQDRFKLEENLNLYTDIQNRIVSATDALNQGLIYEQNRPARMKFITGAESTLQKQGLATIGALQASAAVIKGSIDLAKTFGDSVVNAINDDNTRSFNALNTLLDLDKSDLVSITTEERKIINDRLSAIENQSELLQKNKDDVMDLIMKNPKAAATGGVTMLDTREKAIAKMLPTMSADEQMKFNLDVMKANRESASAIKDAKTLEYKQDLLDYKDAGKTYDEAIQTFGAVLPVNDIAAIYGRKAVGDTSVGNADLMTNFVNTDGTAKEGYEVILGEDGKPSVQKKAVDDTSWHWYNPWSW